jgi:hypothetical protein
MKNLFLKIILILIFTMGITFAHEDHDEKKEKPDTVTVVNGDTIAINGIAVGDSLLATQRKKPHTMEMNRLKPQKNMS